MKLTDKEFREALDELREEEASSVTLVCDNPDLGGPNNAIECCGFWTDFESRRFDGDTLDLAIIAGLTAYRENKRLPK